jgi:hypothetical protein
MGAIVTVVATGDLTLARYASATAAAAPPRLRHA